MRAPAAAERALRCRRREPGPGAGRAAGRVPAQPGSLQKVRASRCNFPGGASSERPDARALCALAFLAEFFKAEGRRGGGLGLGVRRSLSMTQEENAFGVPTPDPKLGPDPSPESQHLLLDPSPFGAPLPYHHRGCQQPGAIWVRLKDSGGFVPVASKTCRGSDPVELMGVIIPGEIKIWGYFIADERFLPPTLQMSSSV